MIFSSLSSCGTWDDDGALFDGLGRSAPCCAMPTVVLGPAATGHSARAARDSSSTMLLPVNASHVPRKRDGSIPNLFKVPLIDRMKASRGRGRSFVASQTTQFAPPARPSRNNAEVAQCSSLHARRRSSSSSDKGGKMALYDLLLIFRFAAQM